MTRPTVQVLPEDRSVTVRWRNFRGGIGVKIAMVAVVVAPMLFCLFPAIERASLGVAMVCMGVPVAGAVLVVLMVAGGSVEIVLSEQGVRRSARSAIGWRSLSAWRAPAAVYVVPMWNFDARGNPVSCDQWHVAFMYAPGVAIDSLVMDAAEVASLVDAVKRLNSPAVLLDARSLLRTAPSSLCDCGYDLIAAVHPRCPECGTEIPPHRLQDLRRMHAEGAGPRPDANRPAGPPV